MSKVPSNLQFELALLWSTLSILKNIDGISVTNFYEKFIPTVKNMPSLSLSSYWEEVYRLYEIENNQKLRNLVGLPPKTGEHDKGHNEEKDATCSIMNIPELEYLKQDEFIDHKHDPLQLVQNIYGAAATIVDDVTLYNKAVLLSACTAIAVKSGRASLLLHLVSVLSGTSDASAGALVSMDIDVLRDIQEFVQAKSSKLYVTQMYNNSSSNISTLQSSDMDPLDHGTMIIEQNTASPRSSRDFYDCAQSGINGTFETHNRPVSTTKGILLSCGKADHGK
jgi:hypothetical protein